MALPKSHNELSEKLQEALGIPPGMSMSSPYPFKGMNVKDGRTSIEDQEFFLIENFIQIGNGKLRSVWDQGSPIYVAPLGKTIVFYYFYTIHLINYCAVFLSDGTAVQVETDNLAQIIISNVPGTFYTGPQLPCAASWGSQYLLIANNFNPNAYWLWDGAILYTAGSLSPNVTITSGGSGYSSVPIATAFGGSGSGATFAVGIANGSVVSVTPTNPGAGYSPGDNVQILFTGGGSDSGAELVAVLTTNTIGSIEVLNGGSSYSSSPTVSFINGGGHASATATLVTGEVDSIAVDSGGVYTAPPTVVISGGGGSGAIATANLTGTAITSFTVSNPGSGYSTPPTISFYGGGNAAATATVDSGIITGIALTDPGTGFTSTPTIVITDSTGNGATALAILSPGSVSSVTVVNGGTGFVGTPTLTFQGGGGTGAAANANMVSGSIASVTVLNGGTGYTSPPVIVVQSGINNAASAIVALMPFGVSGSSIETYQQRVFLTFPNQQAKANNAGTLLVSAPESYTDFATSDGGLIYQSSSPFLRAQYFNIKQSNGYLYPFGDSSVDVISNLQTSGNPPTTTFNYQNTDPQTGTSWRDSYLAYARSILFANIFGIFGLYGGAATKISAKLDDIFTNALFPPAVGAVLPSAAVANIFSQKISLLLITIQDPVTFANRNVMLGWDEHNWSLLSQSSTLTYIATQVVNSNLIAYGTDGTNLFPMFATPSMTLNKRLVTKLYGSESQILVKEADMVVIQAQDLSSAQAGITFQTATIDNENGSYDLPNQVTFKAPRGTNTMYSAKAAEVPGCNVGMTLISNSPDFEINYLGVGHRNTSGIYGSQDLQQGGE